MFNDTKSKVFIVLLQDLQQQ